MPHMRNITVQFAVPEDDPCFSTVELRDHLQAILYDQEGMEGSFQMTCVEEYDDPGDRTATFFEEQTREVVKRRPAKEVVAEDQVKRAELTKKDLGVLEEWAKLLATGYRMELKELDPDNADIAYRLMREGYMANGRDALSVTPQGFSAIGWGV